MRSTIKLWPGVGEEQLGTKAYLVRAGCFKDVDVVLFTHVGNDLTVSWGTADGTGMLSVEYTFQGESAHAGSSPWRGRSALDAVELMNIGWNFRREHLRTQQHGPLCHHRRWRSAERRAVGGERLVLPPASWIIRTSCSCAKSAIPSRKARR